MMLGNNSSFPRTRVVSSSDASAYFRGMVRTSESDVSTSNEMTTVDDHVLLFPRVKSRLEQVFDEWEKSDDEEEDNLLVSLSAFGPSSTTKESNSVEASQQQKLQEKTPSPSDSFENPLDSIRKRGRNLFSPKDVAPDEKLVKVDVTKSGEGKRRRPYFNAHAQVFSNTTLSNRSSSTKKTCSRLNQMDNMPKLGNPLTYQEKENQLSQIELLADKLLQTLLYNADFRFSLFPHQFIAVRRAAGVHPDFPLHPGSKVSARASPMTAKIHDAVHGLDLPQTKTPTKGLCIADSMGLGKTVEAIAGAILIQEIEAAQGLAKRPVVIVTPNDAVQIQWRDTLVHNGVSTTRIHFFKKEQTQGFRGTNNFILLTRHTAAAEIRAYMEQRDDAPEKKRRSQITMSPLFPFASPDTLWRLQQEYLFDKGKGSQTFRAEGETRDDTVTRIVARCQRSLRNGKSLPFSLLVIDEAHFLKNRITYWTFACALMAVHAKRSLPLTGTPYNNGLGDLGTIMCMIDPSKNSANTWWWKKVTEGTSLSAREIIRSTKTWHEQYMLKRGKEVIMHLLPSKFVTKKLVPVAMADLTIYSHYEGIFESALRDFNKILTDEVINPIQQRRLKDLYQLLMACMSCMRSSLIHPLLPSHGREVTMQFSPTRCHLASAECPEVCVCCHLGVRPSISEPRKVTEGKSFGARSYANTCPIQRAGNPDNMEEGVDYNDDDQEVGFEKEGGAFVPIPYGICNAQKPFQHFAHQHCLDGLAVEYMTVGKATCPRCRDLRKRACGDGDSKVPLCNQKFWCKDLVSGFPNGFIGSPKLNAVMDWILRVPSDDKILVVSFFKGCLDLIEGILIHDLKWDCARFDGDVTPSEKLAELTRFKNTPTCRVLLMTVQSGGVGLNITEGNHVCFLDRWFNPFVHDQAEDRCYRLGQKKDVYIQYFDVAATLDEVICEISKVKQKNSKVLLANGTEIGTDAGGLSYTELSGLISRLITAIQCHREIFLSVVSDDLRSTTLIPAFLGMGDCLQQHEEKLNAKAQQKAAMSTAGKGPQQQGKIESSHKNTLGDRDGLEDAIYVDFDDIEFERGLKKEVGESNIIKHEQVKENPFCSGEGPDLRHSD